MRKALVLLALLGVASGVWGFEGEIISREEISLRAGPTVPGEGLSLLWVESYVYPKVVKDEGVISLGVRLTSKVSTVLASFDFGEDEVFLASSDGLNWSEGYRVSRDVADGLHVVRYTITGEKGSISRTVDFFLEQSAANAGDEDEVGGEEDFEAWKWDLTVSSTCAALVEGSSRILYAGQKLTGISKMPWYKVIFEDGEEGWLPASMVIAPLDDYFTLGVEIYDLQKYAQAIKCFKNVLFIDPDHVDGHLWMAKSYDKLEKLDLAHRSIKKAMSLDERNINSKIFAGMLAFKYYEIAHTKFKSGRYHEAIASYQRALDLKPASVTSRIELGTSYERLGFAHEARSAWREVLKHDPENKEVYALLKIEVPAAGAILALEEKSVPAVLADDSLEIVKAEKTRKGTKIDAALGSLIAMTKSLGTPVVEKGWEIKKRGEKFLVSYVCEQGKGAVESFEWLVDIDSRHVTASNDNARVLTNRW